MAKGARGWTQNKADMIARLVGAYVVPVMREEEIVAIAVGETMETAQARAAEIVAARLHPVSA